MEFEISYTDNEITRWGDMFFLRQKIELYELST